MAGDIHGFETLAAGAKRGQQLSFLELAKTRWGRRYAPGSSAEIETETLRGNQISLLKRWLLGTHQGAVSH